MNLKIKTRNKNIRVLINKNIFFSFFSILIFFKKIKNTKLSLFFIKYLYTFLINLLYAKLKKYSNIAYNNNKLINMKLLPKNYLYKNFKLNNLSNNVLVKGINLFILKIFNNNKILKKSNLLKFIEFQKIKKNIKSNIFFNNLKLTYLNFINTIFGLVFFNKVNKSMFKFFFLSKSKQIKNFINFFINYFYYKNNIIKKSINKYQEIFLLPLSLKIKKIYINKKKLKVFESIFIFKFIRRFRILFYYFIFYFFLFWFNKLILKTNNKIIINNNFIIRFFKIYKNLINFNIKHVWLTHKILIPNFNLNYMLYNNIIKQW